MCTTYLQAFTPSPPTLCAMCPPPPPPPAGFSPFPGNINQLIIKLSSYVDVLGSTHGVISEFVNPKYKDASRTTFKSSTRLECMMQDYPRYGANVVQGRYNAVNCGAVRYN